MAVLSLKLAYAAALLLLPGMWIAGSSFCRPLRPELRIAAACVFSPFVLAGELVLSALAGMPFGVFISWIVPLNLLAAIPVWRQRRELAQSKAAWPDVAVAAALILPLGILLIHLPLFRQYGWHNMMQVAVLQQFDRLPHLPEEMDAAGWRLNYGWLGFTQLATICRVLNASPTRVFPALNIAQFVSLFLFCAAGTRRLAQVRRGPASVATAIALLLPGLLDIAWASLSPSFVSRGELRITPMTSKFLYIDEMATGLSSFALVAYAALHGLLEVDGAWLPLLLLGALACGVAYPLLFPSCMVVVCLLGGALLAGTRWPRFGIPEAGVRRVVVLFIGMSAVTALAFTYIFILGASAVTKPVALAHRPDVHRHLLQLVLVFGSVVVVPGLWALTGRWRGALAAPVALMAMFVALSGCFIVLVMPRNVEYKFLFAALLIVVPVVGAVLCAAARNTTAGGAALGVALAVVLAATSVPLWRWHVPRPWLEKAVWLDEGDRAIHPTTGWNGGWMQAVEQETPPETVLLTDDTDQPVSVFTGRAVYMTLDESGRAVSKPGRAGYAMKRDLLLARIKGYPADEIDARVRLIRDSLTSDANIDIASILRALGTLNRPIAVHTTHPSTLVGWLRVHHVGASIYHDGSEQVWVIDQPSLCILGKATDIDLPSIALAETSRSLSTRSVR